VSGADISAFGSPSGVETGPGPEEFLGAIAGLGKPVIAVLRGWCLGGGDADDG
jgi:enoyl-CoA hydratase/carnithine racemase